MIRNYIKTAIRNIFKYRTLSVVNVLGLTLGLSCTILVAIYIRHELSYDRFHQEEENIYRIERILTLTDHTFHSPHSNHQIAPKITEELPEVKKSARIWDSGVLLKDRLENFHEQNIYFVDSTFFEIFSFPLLEGNKNNVLNTPNSAVLSCKAAEKYFGTLDISGRTLEMQILGQTVNLQITGLMKNFPENSHLQTDILASYQTIENVVPRNILDSWVAGYLYSYVLLNESADPEDMKENLTGFVNRNMGMYKNAVDIGKREVSDFLKIHFQPLTDIYLTDLPHSIGPAGDIDKLYTAGAIALLILIIACINYINLSTAKSLTRSREVGLRKVFGADRKRVMLQFVSESVVLAVMAIIISMVILESIMPFFNSYLNKNLSIGYFENPWIVFVLLGFSLIVGLLAGLYPALYISSYRPAIVLKQKGQSQRGSSQAIIRKGLVIIQFAVSVGLIISVFTMNSQLRYMVNKDPGFQKEKVLIVPVSEQSVQPGMKSIKEALLKNPEIENIGRANKTFGAEEYSDCSIRKSGTSKDEYENVKLMWVDDDFIPALDIKMIAGRNYSESFQTDKESSYVMNEKAIKMLNFSSAEEAIGKEVTMHYVDGEKKGRIVGVMKDFHYMTMESEIAPIVFLYSPENTSKLFVRLNAVSSIPKIVGKVRNVFKKHAPGLNFRYSFLEEEFNANYQDEIKMRKLFTVFTLLAIFIACMGLFGLASFMTEQKTKEIGIRKSMGATSLSIVIMLSSRFLKWVLISNIIAWPLIYFFMSKWLQDFAYHVELNWVYFLLASIITIIIAQLTVFYKAYVAARTNPVDSLRYE